MRFKYRGLEVAPMANGESWIYSDEEMPEVYLNHPDKLAYIDNQAVVYKTVTQYTGLKDKNGTEIYEKDILEVEPEDKEHFPKKSVFFVESSRTLWGYDFSWEHVSGYDCSTHIADIDNKYEQLLNVEVIGNTFENPELLEREAE